MQLRGDFSLNAANSLSARDFLSTGIARLTPTHDLNGLQIRDLALSLGAHSDEKVSLSKAAGTMGSTIGSCTMALCAIISLRIVAVQSRPSPHLSPSRRSCVAL